MRTLITIILLTIMTVCARAGQQDSLKQMHADSVKQVKLDSVCAKLGHDLEVTAVGQQLPLRQLTQTQDSITVDIIDPNIVYATCHRCNRAVAYRSMTSPIHILLWKKEKKE